MAILSDFCERLLSNNSHHSLAAHAVGASLPLLGNVASVTQSSTANNDGGPT